MRKSIGLLAALALVLNFSIASAQGEAPPDAPEGGAAPEAPEAAPAPAPDPAPAPAAEPAPAPAAAGGAILTSAGTMSIWGGAAFVIDNDGDNMGMSLQLAPQFGYFLMDNLMLHGGVGLDLRFGDRYEGAAKGFGFNVGAQYFFMQMGAMKMYGGLSIGLDMIVPDEGDSWMFLPISIPVGVLYSLNEHVALDLGLKFTYRLGLAPDGVSSPWEMPVGLVGVRGHF